MEETEKGKQTSGAFFFLSVNSVTYCLRPPPNYNTSKYMAASARDPQIKPFGCLLDAFPMRASQKKAL